MTMLSFSRSSFVISVAAVVITIVGCGRRAVPATDHAAVNEANNTESAAPNSDDAKSEATLSDGSRRSLGFIRNMMAGSEKNRAAGIISNDVAAQWLDTIPELPTIRSFCREKFGISDVSSATMDQLRDWLCTTYSISAVEADTLTAHEIARRIQQKTGKPAPGLPEKSGDIVTVNNKNSPYEYRFYQWQEHRPPVKMIHSSEGFCYLTQIGGAFQGGGEVAKIEIADDGFWYLSGKTSAGHLRLSAVAVKIKR